MKNQKGFTLIELLLVLAIIGIISAIAIPALLGQRARARDKSAISNMDGRVGDLVGQYDKFKEAGWTQASIVASLSKYLVATGNADKNPWDAATAAFNTSVVNVGVGAWANQQAAVTALKTAAAGAVKGQPFFQISFPGAGIPGFVGGAVLIDGKVNNSTAVYKVTAIE
jgi:prepilin-type N-terminal cleavage/methylation domain-containing protein